MASKKTVNLANLEALGAKRLAEILLELGMGDAGVKRRLRLELSAEAGAGPLPPISASGLPGCGRLGLSSTGKSVELS